MAVVPRPPGKEERAAVGPRQPPHVQQDLVADTAHMTSQKANNEPRLLEFMLVCDQEGLRSKGPILRAMFVNSAVSLVAEDVDVELVGDVQDQLHQLVVALKDLQLGLPRA